MDTTTKEATKTPNLFENAGLISRLSNWWSWQVLRSGSRRELSNDDLCEPMSLHKSSYCAESITKAWDEEVKKCKSSGRKPNLLNVIFKEYGWKYGTLCIFTTIQEVIPFVQVYFLYVLLQFYSKPQGSQPFSTALYSALGIAACFFFKGYLQHFTSLRVLFCGLGARIAVGPLLYQKILRLRKAQKCSLSSGLIINLFAIDSKKVENIFQFFVYMIIAPMSLISSCVLMWFLVGWSALPGIAFALATLPTQILIARKCSSSRHEVVRKTDVRVNLMNQIITGIHVLKMYAWEKPFTDLIYEARKVELKSLRAAMRCRTAGAIALIYRSRVTVFLVILTYIFANGTIDSCTVYVLMTLLNINHMCVAQLMTRAWIFLGEALTSFERITDFLLTEEDGDDDSICGLSESESELEVAVRFKSFTAAWSKDSDPVLKDVDLDFPKGEISAVIGTVGSGKSSLLEAIMGEMAVVSGSVRVSGSISYAGQEPWVFQGSLRDNIVFGQDFNVGRYQKVIKVCQLDGDIATFPDGDLTIVGERGVMLSGGQKARVGLARAAYRDADVYLLDDPLSAVDVTVGGRIFDECFTGALEGKTVILLTHQLQALESVRNIVLLENGSVKAIGSFSDLKGIFHDIQSETKATEGDDSCENQQEEMKIVDSCEGKPSMSLEYKMFGSVSGTPLIYLKSGGSCWVIFLFIGVFVLTQVFATAYDIWQNQWVKIEDALRQSRQFRNGSEDLHVLPIREVDSITETSLIVLSIILLAMIVAAISEVFYYAHFCSNASWTIHDKMFKGVIRTSMAFFNSNTSGRILNRFSQELSVVDEFLTEQLTDSLSVGLLLAGSLVVVVTVNPYIIASLAVSGLLINLWKNYYTQTSSQLKKLESASRSPIIAHINQTLNGLSTIRAFNAQSILMSEFHKYQDHNAGAQFLHIGTNRLYAICVELIGCIYCSTVVLCLLVLDTGAANVGLSITQVSAMSWTLQYFVRLIVDLETALTSVERTTEYAKLPSETNWGTESDSGKNVTPDWPAKGKITFRDVSFRHQKTGPAVLENLNFTVMPMEKIGIVGRTGAGKSSLIGALFRLAEVEGSVEIDDVDASAIPLHALRSRMSIIPQDPVLFSGSLRKNIDPFDEYTDDQLWTAIEEVELKEVVSSLPNGLETEIAEGGGNLSVGQKQLVCLARAIVRNNKILVLDEATANVDHETDALIQKTIRNKFGDKTVLSVAHRLNTVMDSDKILVLSNGRIVEFDHPHVLLEKKDGYLTDMVSKCGKTTGKGFRLMAEQNYEQKKGSNL